MLFGDFLGVWTHLNHGQESRVSRGLLDGGLLGSSSGSHCD